MECITNCDPFASRAIGLLRHFTTTSDAGSDTGSERSRTPSMKL
jgi:hypothetical protein